MIITSANRFISSRHFILLCFILGIVLRTAWLLLVDSKPVSDSSWYHEKGMDFAAARGYIINGVPTAYYPAGYPMFLGLIFMIFGNSIAAAKIANLLISAGILYFSYFTAKKLFDSERTGKITLFLIAVYPNYIAYTSILATELLFVFLLFLGAYLLFISKNRTLLLVFAGIAWGAMCLVKPQGIFIPLLFLAASIVQDRNFFWAKIKPVIILYILMIAVLAPWAIRNYYIFYGSPLISTNDGINLVMGNNPYATGDYNLDDKVIAYIWDDENEYASPDSLVKNIHYSPYWTRWGFKDENHANVKLRGKAINYIKENPGKFLKLLPRKLWLNYKRGNEGVGWAASELEFTPVKEKTIKFFGVFANYFYYTVMILSVLYFISAGYKKLIRKQKTTVPVFAVLIILYFTLLSLVYFGSYRFSFPAIPFFIIFAAALIEGVLKEKRDSI